jgi:hypothetical protein
VFHHQPQNSHHWRPTYPDIHQRLRKAGRLVEVSNLLHPEGTCNPSGIDLKVPG